MLYSIEYTKQFQYHDKDNIEYWINYNGHDAGVKNFLTQNPHKKIVIRLDEKEIINFLAEDKIDFYETIIASKINTSFSFLLKYNNYSQQICKKLYEKKIPFFFDIKVNSWDILYGLLDLHASEIYVCEELAFELEKVSKIIRGNGAKVRIYPNICQSTWASSPALKQFFIRPEDVDLYEPYVDTLEFWGTKKDYNVLYETYAIKKRWYGYLNEVIVGLVSDIDNRCIAPGFGKVRLHCNKKCLKGEHCSLCETIEQLANNLLNKDIIIKSPN
jgi:hypothetical protein